ncbi:MAG: class I SAM-dependent methyltransferase, partial [Candidatus Eremiobacteraeota bacterium]|nr:class I SAM-dependent methyltransferase [Candidatus Eremiobacteraeota bacterium]
MKSRAQTGAGDGAGARLELGLAHLGFAQPRHLAERLMAFGALLLEANRDTNLVGASAMEELVATHFLDSLAPLAGRWLQSPVIDVGSGAGLPGIPAALAFPSADVVLL